MNIKAPRGTFDILPGETPQWHHVEKTAREIAHLHGYMEIRTPVFEHTELFVRGIGEGTDIVQKEMYVFKDKKGRSMTLRPEGTATVVRACLEHNLHAAGFVKLYYIGPFLRYERPQAGRYRQFHQFGIEALGSSAPSLDAEVIEATHQFFSVLGLKDLHVEINSIGCRECRPAYRESLQKFLKGKAEELCDECGRRLEHNPLRILDCKNRQCREISQVAPSIFGFLCQDCRNHFGRLQSSLEAVKLPFTINPLIVRGLDYYTKTVFEVISQDLGAQDALCGGGRYDHLAEELGGKALPAVGVAIGLERTLSIMNKLKLPFPPVKPLAVYLVALGEDADLPVQKLMVELRRKGFLAERDYQGRSLKSQMKDAHGKNARCVLILGSDELKTRSITFKDMVSGEQQAVPLPAVVEFIEKRLE
ncbi:MAG: histidine--tRNA ligase [Candidatus Eremiobacteraeota bacterium]|nr:histidine--tRNA ligase [Candidatus Eremiobacteraeota bacterium]